VALSCAFAAAVLAPLAPLAQAEEVGASDSKGINLTIYNQNFGLVKDIRNVGLNTGIISMRFADVAAKIDPTSVSFVSLTAPNAVVVREQNYQYDLIDPTTILSKSIGKTLKFRQIGPSGTLREFSGTLLNSPRSYVADPSGTSSMRWQGLVVKTPEGIVLNPAGEIEIAELPPGLISKPSLYWKLESTKAGEHQTEIAYQTAGLNWHADYVAVLNKNDNQLDLTSWVTLDNKSGASYKSAALKLMAGDVRKVTDERYQRNKMMETMRASAAPAQQFQEQAFAEYHLYTLQGKTDVNDNETKQLSLFNANQVPAKKQFVYDPAPTAYYPWMNRGGDRSKKVAVKIEVDNSEKNNLGMPLPKGKVRVYKRDADGALQFIGEDLIDHTPQDEKIRLYIGDAFDVVGERKQLTSQRISDRVTREAYEISLRNHKDKEVTVTAVEHAWGTWKILSSSHEYKKKDSGTFEFNVVVPASGEVKITYEIEHRY
jgi:hypothetical protein